MYLLALCSQDEVLANWVSNSMRFVPVIFRFLLPEQSSAADEVAEAEEQAEK